MTLVDALAHLLDGPRARGAILLRALLEPPWSIRLQDDSPLGLLTILRGTVWLTDDDAAPILLPAGTVIVVKNADPVTIADDPATRPQVVVHPGWRWTTPAGEENSDYRNLGVRGWGNDPDGSTAILLACYQVRGEISQRVLDALPSYFLLPPGSWNDALVPVLVDEITADGPAQGAVLDRLFDLLLVSVIRDWFADPGSDAPGWFQAHTDPVVGRALRLLHERPAESWTIARIATEIGVSRSAFARTFTDRIGVPPMTYLKQWRLSMAADLLLDPDRTLDAIARRVGYSDGFALSSVFKRERGVSPRTYRETASRLAMQRTSSSSL